MTGQLEGFDTRLHGKMGVFSQHQIEVFIDKEERHDLKILTKSTTRALRSMSSGERKKMLLNHLLEQDLDCLILVNPYDNLDIKSQISLKEKFEELGKTKQIVQLLSRAADILPIPAGYYSYKNKELTKFTDLKKLQNSLENLTDSLNSRVPSALKPIILNIKNLVQLKNISVSFDGHQVLHQIDWTIKKGEFWELSGPNGSGKTTLLNMITGDSPKSYGQDVMIFGHKKGSGESVWDIKELIGYFTPAMTDKFRGYHTLENMLVSGLYDSIGLYQKPSDTEKRLAQDWLNLIGLDLKKNEYFHQLSLGEKRLVMIARAMVKHPPLLILDEPTAGLDDTSASFSVALVNKFSKESNSAIVFVSHRKEPGLGPQLCLELEMTKEGSKGKIHYF